ncbi:pca operon transcription factor PcaQ [Rhizobium beringeri]
MIDSRVKFRHLQTFVEVARQKSVMKAAELLHVSQPAVTKTIRELEQVLGVEVFERDGRGIKITRYGEVFLRHAGAALTALRQGLDSVSQEQLSEAPPIRIGALPTVSSRIMPRAMELFLKEKTWSRVKIVTGENAVLLEQLRVGDLDIVVGRLAGAEKMAGFSFEHLYSGAGGVCRARRPSAARRPAIAVCRLCQLYGADADAGVDHPAGGRKFLDRQRRFQSAEPDRDGVGSFGRAFLRASDAIWIISNGVVANDVADGRLALLPVDMGETKGPVGLTMRADAVPSLPQSILMQTIREAAGEVA